MTEQAMINRIVGLLKMGLRPQAEKLCLSFQAEYGDWVPAEVLLMKALQIHPCPPS